jgi:hypothetical protein
LPFRYGVVLDVPLGGLSLDSRPQLQARRGGRIPQPLACEVGLPEGYSGHRRDPGAGLRREGGRENDQERILIHTTGLVSQDVALAYFLCRRAAEEGIGLRLPSALAAVNGN